jgi:beta-N-acetylhexosaminidase
LSPSRAETGARAGAGPRAAIFGLSGPALTADERAFFRDADPWGFILFARNVADPAQVSALTAELRAAVGRDAPVLIDQEGGRVQRLRPPHWRAWPDPRPACEALAEADAARMLRLRYRLIAQELRAVGVDVDCAPLLDVPQPGAHPIIGDRAYAAEPGRVARLGRAVREGLAAGGVAPIVKHVPGHGRAGVDSHEALPRVEAPRAALDAVDFAPFRAHADAPMAMTAHVVFEAVDPEACATFSPAAVRLIRDDVGFDGLLMTDDLGMGALDGPMAARVDRALAAGCDMILHCDGDPGAMRAIAAAAPRLTGRALARARAAEAARGAPEPFDVAAAEAELATLAAVHA